jgi:hypothetical protein
MPDDDALARRAAIQLYLHTGDYDPKFPAWSGNIIERETKAMADMLQALVEEVKKLSGKIHAPSFPADLVAPPACQCGRSPAPPTMLLANILVGGT